MKNALQELQDGKCAYCELPLATRNPEIEHIAPKGGIKRVKHIECMFYRKILCMHVIIAIQQSVKAKKIQL